MRTPSAIDIRVREFIAKEANWRASGMERPSNGSAHYEITRIAYLPNRTTDDTEFVNAVLSFLESKAKSGSVVRTRTIEGNIELRVNAKLLDEVRTEFQGLGRNT